MSQPSYATTTQLAQLACLSAAVLATISNGDQTAALDAASREADSYLASRFVLPLVTWGTDLSQRVCDVAAYRLMSRAGYNPEGANADIRLRYEDALSWFRDVARGLATVDVVDTTPAQSAQPQVVGGPVPDENNVTLFGPASLRGW